MTDIANQNEAARKEWSALVKIMTIMTNLDGDASRVKVLGAVALMARPTVPIREEAKMAIEPPGKPPAGPPTIKE